jgi:hypothetical protein
VVVGGGLRVLIWLIHRGEIAGKKFHNRDTK